MSWMKHTGCRYHNQDTGYYCGAAAAMMILSEIGVPYSDLDQDDLYNSNHSNNVKSGWATDPYGLRHTLRDRRPASFTNTFVVHKPNSEAEGTRDIVYTLHKYGVSPAVLVFNCMHWIVVPGVQTSVEPASGATYNVEGLWLHNPVHHSGPTPPPHSATDGCGTGGAQGDANEYVTYNDWQTTFFTGCNYDDSAGNDQFISVCDPDARKIRLPRRKTVKRRAKGRRLIGEKAALKYCRSDLDSLNLKKDKRVALALKGTRPGKPMLVTRLDQLNSHYYVIPWRTARTIKAFTRVDARFGQFGGMNLTKTPVKRAAISRDDVLRRVANERVELADRLGSLALFPEALCISPSLVWRPCWESFSPNLPFYQLTVGGHQLYVRVDGEVFTQLTTTGRGV